MQQDHFSTASVESMPNERRGGMRIAVQRPIKVFAHSAERYYAGLTRDLSPRGLCVQLHGNALVHIGSLVSVNLSGGQGLIQRRSMIPARVVWMERQADNGAVVMGVELQGAVAAEASAA